MQIYIQIIDFFDPFFPCVMTQYCCLLIITSFMTLWVIMGIEGNREEFNHSGIGSLKEV